MFCKEDKTYCPPQISRPDYIRGFYYCVRYMTAYKDADICPNCGTKTRKKSRKNGKEDKNLNRHPEYNPRHHDKDRSQPR